MKTFRTYNLTLLALTAILTLGLLTQDANAIGKRDKNKDAKEIAKIEQTDQKTTQEQTPKQFREKMQERGQQRLKKALKITDEKWEEINPDLEKVRNLKKKLNSLTATPRHQMAKNMHQRRQHAKPEFGRECQEQHRKPGFDGKCQDQHRRPKLDRKCQGQAPKGECNKECTQDCPKNRRPEKMESQKQRHPMHHGKQMHERMKAFKPHRALEELKLVVEDEEATIEEITERLENLRKIRKETQEKLAKAQKKLAEKLDARQQAVLVMLGILE